MQNILILQCLCIIWLNIEITKGKLSLKCDKNCILSSEDGNSVFAITDTTLYVLIVTLSTEGNVKLSTLLGKGVKR